ncbi:fumarate/nitrate reduction transcriptional regulator Fnr [Glaciimonas soli]|uniref:Fumarate/nitrate reduction transcriptional regulator Fnr n=1 Tax=Glaciimonas soli TaxID=2590999 RepID=A0A843YIL8_9BURK|nr:fumarate/nitrate reduction transcriptional regulator Fnr [Glaciimonas soli]MQQ99204.1 fumarate/nitrate reduction transcriptional regulator Fnr [Glaciimonas soli]
MKPPTSLAAPLLDIPALRNSCSSCSMRQLCLPMGLEQSDMQRLDGIIGRSRVSRDDTLYRIGDKFNFLFAVRAGQFKTYQVSPDGAQQITGFQMAGELLGMDAIGTGTHQCDAVALENSEVCKIPFVRLEELFATIPALLRHFHRMMSKEITREQSVILLLGNMGAEQRLAAFLVNVSSRYEARGYSGTHFKLRMTREDIGNYLSLTIESISRLLTKLKKDGMINVSNREIEIIDLSALKMLATGSNVCG